MKKLLVSLFFVAGILGVTSLFGASSLENKMIIEQLKKDKSLQADVKEEQQKMAVVAPIVTTEEKKVVPLAPPLEEPLAKNEDIEKKAINLQPSKVYSTNNYYKNFTPFFYEDQISLVDEIEKRQIFKHESYYNFKRVNFFR
jgi:hypothetical protein